MLINAAKGLFFPLAPIRLALAQDAANEPDLYNKLKNAKTKDLYIVINKLY
jgi:hypothetical protein